MITNLLKRMLSFSLCMVLLASSVPAAVFAAEESDTQAASASIQTLEQQIIAYAKSLNFTKADDDAAWALTRHGLAGSGKQLNVGSNHSLTATLMNSKLAQRSLIQGCTVGIETMQEMGRSSLFVNGGCNWNSQGLTYRTIVYPDDTANAKERIYHTKPLDFTEKTNAYDDSLIWMSGSTIVHIRLSRAKVTADTVTYDVTVQFKDRFDFNEGKHTAPEKFASLIGSALFREFDWVATAKFQLTAPNTCTHRGYNYHLTYDAQAKQVISHTSDGFRQNNGEKEIYETTSSEKVYYHLENTIRLEHDRPWVLEYTVTDPNTISFSEVESSGKSYSYLINSGRSTLHVPVLKYVDTEEPYTAYYRLRLSKLFKYNKTDSYTLRLENCISEDGSNMPHLTVYNNTKQQLVLEPTAMDDYYLRIDSAYELQDDQSQGLSGMDFVIRYLGNKSYNFDPPSFEMKVWEGGTAETQTDHFDTKTVRPTCTAKGYTQYTCSLCGYAYKTQYVSAKGHTFGQWEETEKPDCTTAGQLQRQCSSCKQYETQEIEALGHSTAVAPAQQPTCTQTGLTEGTHCTVCDKVLTAQTELAALGHDMGQWTTNREKTCTADGQQQRACSRCDYVETQTMKASGHAVQTDPAVQPTCTKPGLTEGAHCTVCGEILIPQSPQEALGHTEVVEVAKTPTCTETGLTEGKYCAVCGEVFAQQTVIPALGHAMSAWSVTKETTCTVDGEKQRVCTQCDRVETQVCKAPGHAQVADDAKLPTCAETGLTEGKHCAVCSQVLIPQTLVPALGHDLSVWYTAVAATCVEDGQLRQECNRCDLVNTQVIQATGHDYSVVPIFATCTESGYTRYACLCGDTYIGDYTSPLGHNYIPTVTQPGYTEKGYTEHRCTYCDDYRFDSYIDALGLPVPDVTKPTVDPVSGGVQLTWTGCDEADGYEIYRATKKTGKYTKVAVAESEQWLDTAVSVGKTYYYKIKAVFLEDSSLDSGNSGVVSATAKCAKPELSVNAGSNGKPVLSWKKISGAKKYEIWRSVNGGSFKKLTTTTKTSYTDKKAKLGTQYTYKIKAVGSKSSYSGVFSENVSCYATCAAPSVKIKVDTTTGRPVLSWKKISGAAGYEIYRDGQLLSTVTAVSYTDTTAQIGTKHSYQVVTLGKTEALHSLQSKAVSAVAVCAKPKLTGRIGDSSKPELTWTQVEGAAGYAVYRSTSKTKGYKKIGQTEDTAYTDLTAKKKKTYYYKIVALADNGNSGYSSYVKLKSK